MISEYRVSIYGRLVYFLIFLILLPMSAGMLGLGISDTKPYENDHGIFVRTLFTLFGGISILLSISFIGQLFKVNPRICICENGIRYNGFYFHTSIKWEEISRYSIRTVRGGFTILTIEFHKRKWGVIKGIPLDVSGLTPGHEQIGDQIYAHLKKLHDI